MTTYDCGGGEHTLIYASQKEIKHLEDYFRKGRKGEPFKLPNGVTTRVKCYTGSDSGDSGDSGGTTTIATWEKYNLPDPESWVERRKAVKRSADRSSGNPQKEINPRRAPRAAAQPPPRLLSDLYVTSGKGNPQSGE